MKKFIYENSLTIVLLTLFAGSLIGQILTGHREYNETQRDHNQPEVALGGYLGTGHFVETTFENWESEFLQMGMYVLLTVWLRQKGSSESKKIGVKELVDLDGPVSPDAPWPIRRGGIVAKLYEHSLSIALFALFFASFALHAAGGAGDYNQDQIAHGHASVTVWQYVATSRFWFESFQNWQSEFLSVAAVVVLSIFLRQKGSPESKPVFSPHSETGH